MRRALRRRTVSGMPLSDGTPVLFLGARDLERARTFYGETLALPLMHEDTFALVFDAGGTPLRVTRVQPYEPHPFTVAGWEVDDVAATVERLEAAGVVFARFDELDQDARGIWTAPDGIRVAWFRDLDGNVLSVSDIQGDEP